MPKTPMTHVSYFEHHINRTKCDIPQRFFIKWIALYTVYIYIYKFLCSYVEWMMIRIGEGSWEGMDGDRRPACIVELNTHYKTPTINNRNGTAKLKHCNLPLISFVSFWPTMCFRDHLTRRFHQIQFRVFA